MNSGESECRRLAPESTRASTQLTPCRMTFVRSALVKEEAVLLDMFAVIDAVWLFLLGSISISHFEEAI